MINLRYHIVSITAVFLALGIGITMGSTFLGKATLDRIDTNVRDARAQVKDANSANSELRKELSLARNRSEQLSTNAIPRLFNDTLTDVPILLISEDGVDSDTLDELRLALVGSGAQFDGTLVASDKWKMNGDTTADLAKALGSTETSPALLRTQALNRLGSDLLGASQPPVEPGQEQPPGNDPGDLTTTTTLGDSTGTSTPSNDSTVSEPLTTTTLVDAPDSTELPTTSSTQPVRREPSQLVSALMQVGFLDYEPPLGGGVTREEVLTRQGYRYLLVTASGSDLNLAQFAGPLLQRMTTNGPAPIVVASAAIGDDIEALRDKQLKSLIDDEQIGDRISTVDDLELLGGIVAAVWSLEDIENARYGHYGVGAEAKSLVPAARG